VSPGSRFFGRRNRGRDVPVEDARRDFGVRSPMIVLGSARPTARTAAVLRDGEIVGVASEERFSRLKNDAGYPRQAIDALLHALRLKPAENRPRRASREWRAFARDWMNRVMHDAAYVREYYGVRPTRLGAASAPARASSAPVSARDSAPGKTRLPAEERLGW